MGKDKAYLTFNTEILENAEVISKINGPDIVLHSVQAAMGKLSYEIADCRIDSRSLETLQPFMANLIFHLLCLGNYTGTEDLYNSLEEILLQLEGVMDKWKTTEKH